MDCKIQQVWTRSEPIPLGSVDAKVEVLEVMAVLGKGLQWRAIVSCSINVFPDCGGGPHQRQKRGVPRLADSQAPSKVGLSQVLANYAPDLWYVERVDPEAGHGKRCSELWNQTL
jgi:hypothetical protein